MTWLSVHGIMCNIKLKKLVYVTRYYLCAKENVVQKKDHKQSNFWQW